MAAIFKPCSVESCKGNSHYTAKGTSGWCRSHYRRWLAYGTPLGGGTPHGEPQRYLAEVVLKYDGDECLIWPYAKDSNGYGQLSRDGKARYVTRVVCEETYGPPPSPDHQAAHSCGRGHDGCCAPSHLRWATVRDNHADKKTHGTYVRPPICNKLSREQVQEIIALKGQLSQRKIAEIYGVQHAAIGAIHRGRTWLNIER